MKSCLDDHDEESKDGGVNARVLIDGTGEMVFDYAVPEGMAVMPGCRVRVPLRKRESLGTVLAMVEAEQVDFAMREVSGLVEPEPLVTPVMMRLGQWIAEYYGCGMETVVRALLPEVVRSGDGDAKTRRIAVFVKFPEDQEWERMSKRAFRQCAILQALRDAEEQRLPVAELGEGAGTALKALERAGWVAIAEEEVRREPDASDQEEVVDTQALELNDSQSAALNAILEELAQDKPKPVLLLGVTGSGKTEVYLQAAEAVLAKGKNVLVLVPEISLTPQTVRRFRARFAALGGQVAVLHSNLSQGERYDEWHRIRRGEARVIIGARSAVFAPLVNPGLILVDEEHETSYKQETVPRYHGRDVAVLRGMMEGCGVVLGSATPSLESWQNVSLGKYRLVRLDHRADGQTMPLVRVVDMRLEASKHRGGAVIFSDRLRTALEQRLERGEQSILFLNRRGFARSLQCPKCGHVCQCPHCSVALTYHRTEERLVCHVCAYQAVVPRKCPECRDPAILFQGYGTQQVEEVLAKILPAAKFARLDADAMRKKHALRDVLRAFHSRKLDILVGTQMIAKGLHFPNVTLVGILNADIGLHVPDFRAGERTFQLVTQVAGRAGRGDLEGEVVVQTFTPHAASIQHARKHDFDGFAELEMEFRRQFHYPPFSHCAVLTSRSQHEQRAEFTLKTLRLRLEEGLPVGMTLGEVLPSPLVRAHGQYRFQIVMRSGLARPMTRHVQSVLKRTTLPEDVTVVFDMDAHQFS